MTVTALENGVTRQPLRKETLLVGASEKSGCSLSFTITKHIGSGGSSLLYRAKTAGGDNVIIKELFPCAFDSQGAFERSPSDDSIHPSASKVIDANGGEVSKARLDEYLLNSIDKAIQEVAIIESLRKNSNSEDYYAYRLRIIDYFRANRTFYFVMDDEWFDELPKKYDVLNALKYTRRILESIKTLHESAGYLHLDIKPENIMAGKFDTGKDTPILYPIDFNSAVKISGTHRLTADTISRTTAYAAPELMKVFGQNFDAAKIGKHTDMYSAGITLFRFLTFAYMSDEEFNTVAGKISDVSLRNGLLNKCKPLAAEIKSKHGPKVFGGINHILLKALYPSVSFRYKNCADMWVDVAKVAEEAENKIFLTNRLSLPTQYYIKNEDTLAKIDGALDKNAWANIVGPGGTGKSETARYYSLDRHTSNTYHTVHFVVCLTSLIDTIANIEFANAPKNKTATPQERCIENLERLKHCDNRTLLVIDNFTVDITLRETDSESRQNRKKQETELLICLKALPMRVLFTTREYDTSPLNLLPTEIPIENASPGDLKTLFIQYCSQSHAYENAVERLLEETGYHILTVTLIARMLSCNVNLDEAEINELTNALHKSVSNLDRDSVVSTKDNERFEKTVYAHIRALFDYSNLSVQEQYALSYLSFVPASGIRMKDFQELSGLIHSAYYHTLAALVNPKWMNAQFYADSNTPDIVPGLIKRGWVQLRNESASKSEEGQEIINLHPILSDEIFNELKPGLTKNLQYNYFTSSIGTYIRNPEIPYGEKLHVIETAKNMFSKIMNAGWVSNGDISAVFWLAGFTSHYGYIVDWDVLHEKIKNRRGLNFIKKQTSSSRAKKSIGKQEYDNARKISIQNAKGDKWYFETSTMAAYYSQWGRHQEAIKINKKSLVKKERRIPFGHIAAGSHHSISLSYANLSRKQHLLIHDTIALCILLEKEKAEANYKPLKKIRYFLIEETLAKEPIEKMIFNILLSTSNGMASLGYTAEALECAKYIVDGFVDLFPENKEELLYAKYWLGRNYMLSEEYENAVKLLEDTDISQASSIMKLRFKWLRAGIHTCQGNFDAANEILQAALTDSQDMGLQIMASTLDSMAYTHEKAGHYDLALTYAKDALALYDETYPNNCSGVIAELHLIIGKSLMGLGRHSEAEEMLLRAMEIYESIYLPETPKFDSAAYRLMTHDAILLHSRNENQTDSTGHFLYDEAGCLSAKEKYESLIQYGLSLDNSKRFHRLKTIQGYKKYSRREIWERSVDLWLITYCPANKDLIDTYESLVKVYDVLNKPQKRNHFQKIKSQAAADGEFIGRQTLKRRQKSNIWWTFLEVVKLPMTSGVDDTLKNHGNFNFAEYSKKKAVFSSILIGTFGAGLMALGIFQLINKHILNGILLLLEGFGVFGGLEDILNFGRYLSSFRKMLGWTILILGCFFGINQIIDSNIFWGIVILIGGGIVSTSIHGDI